MGRRSRKRREPGAPVRPAAERDEAVQRGYARAEERNEQIRQSLEPLAPGERPGAVTVAAIVALLLAVSNVGLAAAGVEVSGRDPTVGSTVLQAVVLVVAAAGMWKARYWAVLGFQALLGLSILLAALALMVASSVEAVVFCLAIIAFGGWLFWKLVRALARLQMPERHARPRDI